MVGRPRRDGVENPWKAAGHLSSTISMWACFSLPPFLLSYDDHDRQRQAANLTDQSRSISLALENILSGDYTSPTSFPEMRGETLGLQQTVTALRKWMIAEALMEQPEWRIEIYYEYDKELWKHPYVKDGRVLVRVYGCAES